MVFKRFSPEPISALYRVVELRMSLREELNARKDLEDAERVRRIIINMAGDKWAKNFATPREDMLKMLDRRIGELRKNLGLLA